MAIFEQLIYVRTSIQKLTALILHPNQQSRDGVLCPIYNLKGSQSLEKHMQTLIHSAQLTNCIVRFVGRLQ